MVDLEIRFAGLAELLRRFGNMPVVTAAMDRVMTAWTTQVIRSRFYGMGNYAPERPGSDYIRTGMLGGGWTHVQRGPLQHTITNTVMYATYVVGERQAWMHRGRWWTATQRLDRAVPDMAQSMAQAAAAALESGRQMIASLFGIGRGTSR